MKSITVAFDDAIIKHARRHLSCLLLYLLLTLNCQAADDIRDSSAKKRIQNLLDKIPPYNQRIINTSQSVVLQISNCASYPYHDNTQREQGKKRLFNDIKKGLEIGLSCLIDGGSANQLHPYHQTQALKLIDFLENKKTKTFRCVEDEIFAYGVSKAKPAQKTGLDNNPEVRNLPAPGILLDTYRISGFMNGRHTEDDYRHFFNLEENQIVDLLTGKPVRPNGMHRYKNLPALMFHEMMHWLGHNHGTSEPDLTDLYTSCCFGGSDFVTDDLANKEFQTRSCNILKDRSLWEANGYQRMRLWYFKGYDQLKFDIRARYP